MANEGILVETVWLGEEPGDVEIRLCGGLGGLYWTVSWAHGWMSCPSLFAAVDAALAVKQYGQFEPYGVADDETAEEWARGSCPACRGTGRAPEVVSCS